MSEALRGVDAAFLALPRVLRQAGISDGAARVRESARNVPHLSKLRSFRGMFDRPKFVRTLSRGAVATGFQMWS